MIERGKEAERLRALHQLDLLDTSPNESFDRITRMASRVFGLPVAAVSLTDSDRQWFKSRVGIEHWTIPRDGAPCAQVAESARALAVPDLLNDPRYQDTPLARGGTRFYAGAPLVTRHGHALGALCVLGTEPRAVTDDEMRALSDLASMVMAQIELRHAMGHIDPVSGLPNRSQFVEDLSDLARDRPARERRFLVLVDIATVEQLDEAVRVIGPGFVDTLAREGARRLGAVLGPKRKAYQVSATQIAFLSRPGVDGVGYFKLLREMLETVRSDSDSRFVTTTAVGVVPFVLGEASGDDLLRQAYSAAQDARRLQARVALYSPEVDQGHQRRFALINDFGEALASGDQLRLVFQPRVDLASRRCVGVEALLRWSHPTLGEVSPGEFIPLVERTALARATTDWVIEAAIAQAARWQRGGLTLKMSVNISAANLEEADFLDRLRSRLARHALPPACLELELTESAMMSDSSAALAQLARIAEAGVELAIDDFGTGYSSLSYLQQLPASVLKIDQSFMRDLADDARKQALVGTMVELAHKFDYHVVAEGVETDAVLHMVEASGCDEVQGYLIARPMDAAAFGAWVGEWAEPARAAA